MPDQSDIHSPSPPARLHKCADCGQEFEIRSAFASTANCCEACQRRRLDLIEDSLLTSAPGPAPEIIGEPPRHRKLGIVAGILAVLVIGGFLAKSRVQRFWEARKERQHVERAAEFFAKGDLKHAVLDARTALDLNPRNIEANRIIAKSLESLGSPDAILWRKRLDSIAAGDPENSAALARAAFLAGDITVAEDALEKLKPADRDTALFHEVAAGLAMRKDDNAAAESHWAEAARLNPGEDIYKLNLAVIRIKSNAPEARASALAAFEELRSKDAYRIVALRALIEDAMSRNRSRRARELVDDLVACKDAAFFDKVWRASVLRAVDDPKSAAYLAELKESAVSKPEELSQLFDWMNRSDLALMVSDWAAGLPSSVTAQPPVALTVADAYVNGLDWQKLRAFTESAAWGSLDFLRMAYLSRAFSRLGEISSAENQWGKSLAAAQGDASKLQMLVKLVQGWRWEEGTDDALRKLSADETSPLWVLQALWKVSLKSGDSSELLRLSNLLTKMDPRSVSARNKFIWLSLIRHADDSYPHQLAEKLYHENKTNINVATTHALSLYLEGKTFEALAIMLPFKPDELRDPSVALYYGMFLASAGKLEKAVEFLDIGESAPLLREEKELLTKVKRECRLDRATMDAIAAKARKEKATAEKQAAPLQ